MRKSLRRFGLNIVLVTFTWGQVASAYPQDDVPALKNFLQRSGWTKGDVKLRDIYELTKNELPLDLRFEVERMLDQRPDLKLPKLEVRMIKNGRFEDVQLIAQKGRQSATATLSFRGDQVASLTYPSGGKDIHKKFTLADIYNPVRMIAEAYGPGIGVADRIQFTRFLYRDELALLRPQDRQNYSEQVREALRAAEQAQQRMNGRKSAPAPSQKTKPPTKTSLLWKGNLPLAFAAGEQLTGSCLVLGWIGSYKNGSCEPPAEAKDNLKCPGAYLCSTILYGQNAECGIVKFERGQLNSSAESCNMRNQEKRYDFFRGITSQAEFDKRMKELSLKVNEIRLLCKEPKNEQINECQDLEKHMTELMKVNCEQLTQWKDKFGHNRFNELKCQAPAGTKAASTLRNEGAVPVVAKAGGEVASTTGVDSVTLPTPDQPAGAGGRDGGDGEYNEGNTSTYERTPRSETAPPGESSRESLNDGIHCEGLPLRAAGLDCAGGSVATLTCNSQGEARTHYYCVCGGGLRAKYSSSAKPIACEIEKAADTGGLLDKYRARDRERSPRPKKSWWEQNGGMQGMLGGLMTVGVGFLAYYAQQQYMKQQWAAYYQMYQPQQLRIAPPPTGPVIVPGTSVPGVNGVPVMPGTR